MFFVKLPCWYCVYPWQHFRAEGDALHPSSLHPARKAPGCGSDPTASIVLEEGTSPPLSAQLPAKLVPPQCRPSFDTCCHAVTQKGHWKSLFTSKNDADVVFC